MNDKDLILHPVNAEEFFEQYWELQPLHVSRKDSGHFSEILSAEGINRYLSDNELKYPDIQVVDANRSISAKSYSTNRIIQPDQLLEHHSKGATIILSEVHKKFSAMTEVCWRVNRAFQVVSQANAYLSPPGNQGFHTHYDTHDVFVLQVAGRKTFRFYPSDIELPFTDDTYHPDGDSSGDALEHVELSAGDTLYIPRGMVHDALASEGEPSLHITLGVFPFVVRDLLQGMIQVAAERDVKLRTSVELDTAGEMAATVKKFSEDVFKEDVYAEAVSRLADEVAVDCYQASSESAVTNMTASSVVTVNRSAIHSTEHRDGVFKLRLAGQVIQFTEPMSTAIAQLLSEESVTVESLTGLDPEQQFALCHQLAEVGVIRLC